MSQEHTTGRDRVIAREEELPGGLSQEVLSDNARELFLMQMTQFQMEAALQPDEPFDSDQLLDALEEGARRPRISGDGVSGMVIEVLEGEGTIAYSYDLTTGQLSSQRYDAAWQPVGDAVAYDQDATGEQAFLAVRTAVFAINNLRSGQR